MNEQFIENSMNINMLLFVIYPYIALVVCVLGIVFRFETNPFSVRTKSSQLFERRLLVIGSAPFHVGILGVLGGHAFGLLVPHTFYEMIGITPALKQTLAIYMGGSFGAMCLFGLLVLIYRRLSKQRVRVNTTIMDFLVLFVVLVQLGLGLATIPSSLHHQDGTQMLKFMEYTQGLIRLDTQTYMHLSNVSWLFKTHILLGFTLFLLIPFSRLIHFISIPIFYLTRPYQLVRSKLSSR